MNIRKYCVASILAGTAITMMGLPAGLLSTAQFVPKNDSTEVEAANPESVVDEVLWVVGDVFPHSLNGTFATPTAFARPVRVPS